MGTRSYADVPPTAATIALNAYIFGYGGHSLVTPHAALKQLWWTDERIEGKITRPFVVSKLRGEERGFLDRPLGFGEGLTDDTYMEWILDRAKRLFLILTEIGVPEQIFGCIDDSWDDDDLPVPLENVRNLELAYENDEVLNRRFYDTQFMYLLRELRHGAHIDYGPKEHIPMDYVNTLPPAVSLQAWDRVHLPGRPEDVFMRRKFPLTDLETDDSYYDRFRKDVRKAQALSHEHIANVWASYTTEDAGYVLSDFVGEHTLGTFIDHRMPMQLVRVPLADRPFLLCEWMHCLADALASLHYRSIAHTAIRPSNILIDHDNHIAFADVGSLRTFQKGKKAHKTESYDYAAPESHICRSASRFASSPPISSMGAFGKLRKMSTSSSSSASASSSTGSSTRSNSFCTVATSPITPPMSGRSNSLTTITTTNSFSPWSKGTNSFRNFSRHLYHDSTPSPILPCSPTTPTPQQRIIPAPTVPDPDTLRDLPEAAPEQSDIFSLACVYLDILTFLLKGKVTDFVKYRSTRIASPNNKNKYVTDTSFHCDPDKIDAWMTILKEESEKRVAEPVCRGVPEMLKLVKKMLAQNAVLRPTIVQVRDRLREVLVDQCGVERLCCAGREWNAACAVQDDAGIDCPRARDSVIVVAGCSKLPLVQRPEEGLRSGSRAGDHASILSKTLGRNGKEGSIRRRSSASAATAKISAWRRAFVRSG